MPGFCFLNDPNLRNVIFKGNNVSIIDGRAFGFSGIRSFEVPSSVTAIGTDAFKHCDKLESIVIPDTVQTIGNGAFDDATNVNVVISKDS